MELLIILFGALIFMALIHAYNNVQSVQIRKVYCIQHKWRYQDEQGWVPDSELDMPRGKGARLRCANCLQEPNYTARED